MSDEKINNKTNTSGLGVLPILRYFEAVQTNLDLSQDC